MAFPLVPQGTINRLVASVNWPANPSLNISASYLGKPGIRFTLDGNMVEYLETLTGAVTSPEPYVMFTLVASLIKSQPFANTWKLQWEADATQLGNGTVWPDSTTLSPFALTNCAIYNVRDLPFDGSDPLVAVTIRGYYLINANLYPN
jgi:hypothetical protein